MDSLERAKQLYGNGQYTEAYQMFLRLAYTRDAKAMLELGMMHGTGKGVERSETKAVEWFHKAAILGNAAAQFNMGISYEQGKGVQQDLNEAIEWYEKAAENGSTKANSNLANLYSGNCGGPFNPERAIHHICALDKGQQGLQSFMFLNDLGRLVSESLEDRNIEGNTIYLRQSDAHAAANQCLEGKMDYTSSYILLKDIIFFPELDDSVLSNDTYLNQCIQRKNCTNEELRLIPCYEVKYGSRVYGRFGYLIEEDIPNDPQCSSSTAIGNPLLGGKPSIRSIKRQLEELRASYNEKFAHSSLDNPMSRIIFQVEFPKMQEKLLEIKKQLNRINVYELDDCERYIYFEIQSLYSDLKETLY